MISVVIPALNAASRISLCLRAVANDDARAVIGEVLVVDGGSNDATKEIAETHGARVLSSTGGRGGQVAKGGRAATGEWLLFIHADTVLDENWVRDAREVLAQKEPVIGVFSLAFDSKGLSQKIVAAGAMARTHILRTPYGDQGVLIRRSVYEALGGYAEIPLFEDVDFIGRFVRRYGRRALVVMNARAETSAEKYERDGYFVRVGKNFLLLMQYHLGVAPEVLAEKYK